MIAEQYSKAKFYLHSKKYEKGIEFIREILGKDPDDDLPYSFLALYHQGLMNLNEAAKMIEVAINLNPTEYLHYKVASKIQLLQQNSEKANNYLSKALKINPNDSDLFGFLGFIQISSHQFADALRTANRGLMIDGNNSECLKARAMALSLMGEKEEAQEITNRLLNLNPINAQNLMAKGLISLNDDNESSIEVLKSALSIQPNNPHLINAYRISLRNSLPGFKKLKNWFVSASQSNSKQNISIGILYGLFSVICLLSVFYYDLDSTWLKLYLAFWNLNVVIQLCMWLLIPIYESWLFINNKDIRTLYDNTQKIKLLFGNSLLGLSISVFVYALIYRSMYSYNIALHLANLVWFIHQLLYLKRPNHYTTLSYTTITIAFFTLSLYNIDKDIVLFLSFNIVFRILCLLFAKTTASSQIKKSEDLSNQHKN